MDGKCFILGATPSNDMLHCMESWVFSVFDFESKHYLWNDRTVCTTLVYLTTLVCSNGTISSGMKKEKYIRNG